MDTFNTIIARLGLRHDVLSDEQKKLVEELAVANEKLLHAERVKTNFLSNIRNEINNPITSVLELSRKIAEENLDTSTIQKYAGLIHSDAFNLEFQLRNFIAAAEVESGEFGIGSARVNIYTILFNTLHTFQHLIAKKDLKLSVNNSVSKPFCTDPEKLQLILRNLIANAVEFSNDADMIEISSLVEGGELIISVRDSGEGMEEEKKQLIFDRFRQLEVGVTKPHKGQGLGLSLVKALIDMLGGEISFQSEKGMGSTFIIHIPEAEFDGANSSDGNDFLFSTENEMVF